jgi:hypothetical protein
MAQISFGDDPSASENIITNISELQDMEQNLQNSLDASPSLNAGQRQQIVQKINQLSTIRANLYATIGDLNDGYVDNLTSTQNILGDQLAAIQIIENELEESRNNLREKTELKNNTQRMIEINSYYADKYAESTDLMKIIIYMLVPIIILALLNRNNLIPINVYYVLVVIIGVIAGIYICYRLSHIWSRNNMEYDTYDWRFAANSAPGPGKIIEDPWGLDIPSTCIGQLCCSTGMNWNSTLGKCVIATPTTTTPITTTPTTSASPSTLASSNVRKEAFVTLSEEPRRFLKPDVTLGGESISPYDPVSFIRYN